MSKEDIRWHQRFSNYNKALAKLDDAVRQITSKYFSEGELDPVKLDSETDIIIEGLIQRFEYTHERAWNVMKDFINEHGHADIYGSKDATREAFSLGLIENGEIWMEMIQSRNKTSHTYNEEVARDIFRHIMESYHPAFLRFQQTMEEKRSGKQGGIV